MTHVLLAEPTKKELKAEVWEQYSNGATYDEIFETLDDCMEQIGATYRNTKRTWKDGELLTPEDALRREIRIEEFTKRDFF